MRLISKYTSGKKKSRDNRNRESKPHLGDDVGAHLGPAAGRCSARRRGVEIEASEAGEPSREGEGAEEDATTRHPPRDLEGFGAPSKSSEPVLAFRATAGAEMSKLPGVTP